MYASNCPGPWVYEDVGTRFVIDDPDHEHDGETVTFLGTEWCTDVEFRGPSGGGPLDIGNYEVEYTTGEQVFRLDDGDFVQVDPRNLRYA